MNTETTPPIRKLPYRGPDAVDVGTLAALTKGISTPVRDANSPDNAMTYHNAGVRPDEVELGDR